MNRAFLAACAMPALMALGVPTVLAADASLGDLRIVKPYARATPPGAATAGAYLTIENRGARDRLVGASSPAATAVEIHYHAERPRRHEDARGVAGGGARRAAASALVPAACIS
jgi:copper(I)-binding protein